MVGTPLEQVIGSRIQDLVAADDAIVANALLAGVTKRAEIRLITASAALISVEAVAEELVLDAARCLCLIVTDLSVTRIHEQISAAGKVTHSAMEIAAEELERRVEERTKDLSRSLIEKATLLQEVQHRVHNNLQIMASLLTVQMDCLEPDAPSHRQVNAALSRVIAMTIVHDINHAPDISEKIDFAEYTRRLAGGLVTASMTGRSGIRLELDLAETISVPLDAAVPLGLVLNELITNSVRHAFRDGGGGTIRVSLTETGDGYVELGVGDDGIGLPAGFQWGAAQSFGLKVTKILLRQVRADLSVDVAGAKGVAFKVRWKLLQ
jgi:two-component sensor histidine kinase